MASRLRIRPVQEKELERVIEVWKKAGLPYRPRGRDSRANLRRQRRLAPDLFLGAYVDGRLVGVSIASDDGRRGWINRLAVVPEARRTKVGTSLVKASENALRKRGRRLFCVMIEKGNEASMELFQKTGYSRQEHIVYYAKRPVEGY